MVHRGPSLRPWILLGFLVALCILTGAIAVSALLIPNKRTVSPTVLGSPKNTRPVNDSVVRDRLTPPPTRSIAELLAALCAACRSNLAHEVDLLSRELLERFTETFPVALQAIETDKDSYFNEKRYWLAVLHIMEGGMDISHLQYVQSALKRMTSADSSGNKQTEDQSPAHGRIQVPYEAMARSAMCRLVGAIAQKNAETLALYTMRSVIDDVENPRLKSEVIRYLMYFPRPGHPVIAYVLELSRRTKDPEIRAACTAVLCFFAGKQYMPDVLLQAEQAWREQLSTPQGSSVRDHFRAMVELLGFRDSTWLVMQWIQDETDHMALRTAISTLAPYLKGDPQLRDYLYELLAIANAPMQAASLLGALRSSDPKDGRLSEYCLRAYTEDKTALVRNEALMTLRNTLNDSVLFPLIQGDFDSGEPFLRQGSRASAILFAGGNPESQLALEWSRRFVSEGTLQQRIEMINLVGLSIKVSKYSKGPLVDLLMSLESDPNPDIAKAATAAVKRFLKPQ